jgi:hypothetical protein
MATLKSSSTDPPCMSEAIDAPHPVKQPNLTRKFPLTDMPTGLMAAHEGAPNTGDDPGCNI